MNYRKLNQFVILLLIGLLILIIFTINQIRESLPSSSAVNPYPEPNIDLITSTPSETICDKWFSSFKELSSGKQAIAQEEYQKCLAAIMTPSTLIGSKPVPATPTPIGNDSPFFYRKAGVGTIVETGFSILPSYYMIKNQWYFEQNGKQIFVYAGAQCNDPSMGGKPLEKPFPGLLIVEATMLGEKNLPDEGGIYWTPEKVGPVRIVDADGTNLKLAAEDGTNFIFDISTRQFISSRSGNSPIRRVVGVGEIIESGNIPFPIGGYDFINYWTESKPEIGSITVLAGIQNNNLNKGALVLLASSLENKNNVIEEIAYLMPFSNYALRIAEADGEILTLVIDDGSTYQFDVSSRQFISLPGETIENIEVIPIVKQQDLLGSGAIKTRPFPKLPSHTPTRTPTRTPTPRPTSTALPTYNPYP